ncbi:MAG: hypothetical protein JRH11_12880 [Deltaproteobacteria bacterium]|nr:hypothetical protein [Deltaproteobacteria bacterium]
MVSAGLVAVLAGLGCQAATVTGPGWGGAPRGTDAGEPPAPVDTPGPIDPAPEGADPELVFLEEVLPLLDDRCNGCHTDAALAPVFIDLADPYVSFLDSGVVVVGDPTLSTILTWGVHRGPAWQPEEEAVVADWITLEGSVAAGGGAVEPGEEDPPVGPPAPVGEYETTPQTIVEGDNVVELDGVGLPGAELRFLAQRVALGMHMSRITLYGGDDGLSVTHPTIVTHDGDGARSPDPDDRFAALELVVPAAGTAILAENILLVDFPLDGELSVSFASRATL